jgi:ABC-2 type transport system permease protein
MVAGGWLVREELMLFIRGMLARAYPRVAMLRRAPTWIVQETVLPVLATAAFAYVYRAMHAPERFIGYVILGGAMTAFWLNVLWSMGSQFYWERDSGNLELYIISPAPLMAVLAGMALGGITLTFMRASAILLTGSLLFGVQFSLGNWPAVAGVFLLTLLALYGLGMIFASVFLMWGREAYHLVNLLQEPVYLLSGVNFPVKVLSSAVASAAAVIPLTLGMDALRQLLFAPLTEEASGAAGGGVMLSVAARLGDGLFPVWLEAVLLAILAVVYIAIAKRCLDLLEYRARIEGRLTVRWQ